jgi:hypothetical protein
MKIRSGFVSNSSSSSFVLPVKDVKEKIIISIDVEDLKKIFNSSDESGIYGIVKNEAGLKTFLLDQYGGRNQSWEEAVEDDDWIQEKYDKYVDELKGGKTLVFGCVGYSETLAYEILKGMGATIEN